MGARSRPRVRTMGLLGDRLGPLLLQLPPSCAVEVRHRSWLASDLPKMLRERGAALALIDYPCMEKATAGFVYIRWLGDRRGFPSGHTTTRRGRREDLK